MRSRSVVLLASCAVASLALVYPAIALSAGCCAIALAVNARALRLLRDRG